MPCLNALIFYRFYGFNEKIAEFDVPLTALAYHGEYLGKR
jgi:hypothetical protein